MGMEAGPSHKDRGHRHGGEPESTHLEGGDDRHPHVTTHTEQTRKRTLRGKGAESPRQAASEGTGLLPRTRIPQPGFEVGAAGHQLHTGHPWEHWGGCGEEPLTSQGRPAARERTLPQFSQGAENPLLGPWSVAHPLPAGQYPGTCWHMHAAGRPLPVLKWLFPLFQKHQIKILDFAEGIPRGSEGERPSLQATCSSLLRAASSPPHPGELYSPWDRRLTTS